ncbi:MAG: type II toxin-antitoxin system RelE/ParE family toxin [Roseateles sp.]|uniref:type II toxin-antitoxin system RelE/ParE family toxin n=1 Tax=Roseateles sp. TaxID=1971397 RepID=UPI0040375E83
MTQIQFTPFALADLERIRDFLLTHDPDNIEERIDELLLGLDVLMHAPQIGRRAGVKFRELVIGRAARGYVARYEYMPRIDTVFVLEVRHQRESP